MKWIDIFRMAMGNLRRNRMRTFLTVMGVVVGIGAIIFLVSLGFGLQQLMVGKLANLSALTVITVRKPTTKPENVLTEETIKKFRGISDITEVTPAIDTAAVITLGPETASPAVVALEPKFFDFSEMKVDDNKSFSGNDAKEVILTAKATEQLKVGDPKNIIGKEVGFQIVKNGEATGGGLGSESIKLKVVGVSTDANEKSAKAIVPISIVKGQGMNEFSSIWVKVAVRKQVNTVKKVIESMGYDTTARAAEQVTQIENAFTIVRSVLFGFGFIALAVAAIGIFNTMTISLLERTHEIGIMKAIGGRNRDVARIFTAEASIIGFMGGIFGVGAGWGLGQIINMLVNFLATQVGGMASNFFYMPLSFASWVVLFAFCISTIAGIYPARRASKLNPLEALRYE